MKDNKLKNIGDVLIVNVKPKISGEVVFTEYSDELIGVIANRSVKREFRVLSNSIFWTEWAELVESNLSNKSFISDSTLTIQVRYTRIGNDSSGEIEFVNIHFFGNRNVAEVNSPTINSSVFSNIINTPELVALESNIFKKLYYRGIVAKYVTRGDNSDDKEDEDFISLFNSIAKFFALFIRLFKRFENFRVDFELMREQVRQVGLFFDESGITLRELQYLASNSFDEIRKRGTEMIFKRKGEVIDYNSMKESEVDGELLRLLRNKSSDELVYENIPLNKIGWCLGNSSPMYKGTSYSPALNKVSTGGELTVVDSKMDYEVSFSFIINGESGVGDVVFSIEGFDNLKNKLDDSFVTPNGESIVEKFFEIDVSNLVRGVRYYARGIIHSYSSSYREFSKTNLGVGTNLYFNNPFVKYVIPNITTSEFTSAEVNISNYKISPLVRGTNILTLRDGFENSHSLGFIQSSRMFYCYARNNNNNQSEQEITAIIEKYLMPYNMTDIFVFMSNY